jgi:predicted dehydrogenase
LAQFVRDLLVALFQVVRLALKHEKGFYLPVNQAINRRSFLKQTTLIGGAAATGLSSPLFGTDPGNRKLLVGIIGCNGRGMDHIGTWLTVDDAEIGYVCDVDRRALEKGVGAVAAKQQRKPKGVGDLRKILEDPAVDAVSIATPDHWHTPATILACAAGKHVYVEKPGSHNAHESQLIGAAARKYKRQVQMGNQRRSWPWVIEAMNALRSGELGALYFARCWYANHRPSIGHAKPGPVPDWLDYDLWQGPAPERAFQPNAIHYNWHWFWNWGTGELGNNGVHALDLARWGLAVDYPTHISCTGKRYHFDDDWETPDTYIANFDFGNKGIAWEGHSCDPRGFEGSGFGVTFFGEKGSLVITSNDCKVYDLSDKIVREFKSKQEEILHFQNFADAIRDGKPLNSEINDGQKSSLLCHLGNIAWRTGQNLKLDLQSLKIVGNSEADKFWKRSYRPGWEPKV